MLDHASFIHPTSQCASVCTAFFHGVFRADAVRRKLALRTTHITLRTRGRTKHKKKDKTPQEGRKGLHLPRSLTPDLLLVAPTREEFSVHNLGLPGASHEWADAPP